MHRKSRFLISLVIAAITFGTLWLSLGADHFNRGHKFCQTEYCNSICAADKYSDQHTREIHTDKVVIIQQVVKADTIQK